MAVLITLTIGYLVGSIPIANLVARRHGIDDLRTVGDRNPGFWNTFELLGLRRAWPVLVGDAAKGAAAAALGLFAGPWWLGYLGAAAAMIGHAWPVFARWRGGRSVATFVGGIAVLAVAAVALAAAVGVAVGSLTRRVEWGIRATVFAIPLAQLVVAEPTEAAATGALMTLIGFRFWQASARDRQHDHATTSSA